MNRKKILWIITCAIALLSIVIYLSKDVIMESDIGLMMQDESKRMEKINSVVEVFTGENQEMNPQP